jgi:N-acetylglucosamine malate deacetylase 1
MPQRAFAIAAHPDDIEFGMAGTMLLLGKAGWELHYINIANGSCGSDTVPAEQLIHMRMGEARAAAARMGAHFHMPLVNDLEIFYEKHLLAQVASVIRLVAPQVLLIPSPQDYMEDHTNTVRLAVTAAFARGMPNFPVDPPRPPSSGEIAVYHAQPHANRDGMDRQVMPDFYVDIAPVLQEKREVLAQHRSQKEWLDRSQGMDSYLDNMVANARRVGEMSAAFAYAEGWRRHNPLGFCGPDYDPVRDSLRDYVTH